MRAFAGSLAALGLAGAAWAEPAPPFARMLRQAAGSPYLMLLDAEAAQAQGLADQARARPNPSVSVYGENFAGSAPYRGFGRTETTLQYNHPIELGGKRAARIVAGQAGVAAAAARGHEGRLAYAYDLARAYAAAEIADRRIALAEDEIEEAGADLKVARAMVGAGREARLRQLRAEAELGTLEADLATARANRVAAFARLAALAGAERPYTGLSESLLDRLTARPASGPVDPLQTAGYRAAAAEREAASARAIVERKRAIPDLTAQVGIRRLDADSATALIAGVSLPLHIFDRNTGNIAAAQAALRAADARGAIARLEAQANARSISALVAATDARADAATRAMAAAAESYRLARIAYEAGKSPLIELLAARHGLGVARGAVLDAAAARLDARADLARLAGLTITGDPVQ